ncbi:MAG: hypothetical protein ABA06_00785 [Parcubacteria bacterium C7867-001]|nr:MAG: hypothetical protein ABA06_00785 [Parcubacteria bacterium C7867-001]
MSETVKNKYTISAALLWIVLILAAISIATKGHTELQYIKYWSFLLCSGSALLADFVESKKSLTPVFWALAVLSCLGALSAGAVMFFPEFVSGLLH